MDRKYVDKHKGEVGIIVGNGPSLNDVPVEFLESYTTFGTNLIYLYEGWEPTYYVAVDPSAMRNRHYIDYINDMSSTKFIGNKILHKVGMKAIHGVIELKTRGKYEDGFAHNPFKQDLWEGWSVTYVAMQLAWFMGFKTILLVGADHRYAEGAVNHFHPEYDKHLHWVAHDMTKAVVAYELAKQVYTESGRKIINLTPGSDLHVFEMGDIMDWLKPKQASGMLSVLSSLAFAWMVTA